MIDPNCNYCGKFEACKDHAGGDGRAMAALGLDIAHYPGKWSSAQDLAKTPNQENFFLPYWERVRLIYLELGGEFTDRRRA